MPPRDPAKVQLDNPLLVADLIAQLNLQGAVGVLDFDSVVRPVYIVGDRDLSVDADPPTFQSAEFFTGSVANPVANVVLVDTGALAAGIFDVFASISWAGTAAAFGAGFRIVHRNAANTATLATLAENVPSNVATLGNQFLPVFGYTIALNERLQWLSTASNLTGHAAALIGAALRPTP